MEDRDAVDSAAQIALVHTIDGGLHAVRRDTGVWLWSVADTSGTAVRSSTGADGASNSTDKALTAPSASSPETYIVEPGQSGAIYVRAAGEQRLQRLPFTLPQLVELSPLQVPGQEARLFVGRRSTSLVGVDLASGGLAGVFGPDDGWCAWGPKSRTSIEQSCGDDIQDRPADLLFIGRTEYRLSIFSTTTGELLHELSYTAFQPNRDSMARGPDATSLQLLSDGSIVSVPVAGRLSVGWRQQLPSPAVAVYDVVPGDDSLDATPGLALQARLHPPASQPPSSDVAYVGSDPDSRVLYVMSQEQHALIGLAGAPSDAINPLPGLGLHRVQSLGPRLNVDRRIEAAQSTARSLLDASPQRTAIASAPVVPTIGDGVDRPSRWPTPLLAINAVLILCLVWLWTRAKTSASPSRAQRRLSRKTSRVAVTDTADMPREWADKELPPLPTLEITSAPGPDDEASDAAGSDREGDASTMPRKPRRRKRGKKKPALANGTDAADAQTAPDRDVSVGPLVITPDVLGYGSHGTVVLRGTFQGRAVAVKRLLKHFVTIADHEVALLQESDEHPNVIRWICSEQHDDFLYIALELCLGSLADVVERPQDHADLAAAFDGKSALRQIVAGVAHLHRLKLCHRDLKPGNVLVTRPRGPGGPLRMLISDFGLCKRLDPDASSFAQTAGNAGSAGWRAPEALRGEVDLTDAANTTSSSGAGDDAAATAISTPTVAPSRLTRAIDIFSLGCLFHWVLTSGDHPFGGRFERETNVLADKPCLDRLVDLGDEAYEARSLIASLIAHEPCRRPTAASVARHPFFWTPAQRLQFIVDASDRCEICVRDPPDPPLVELERNAVDIVGVDWQKGVDRALLDNLGKYRKYDGGSVRDLLRVIRNKKNHYQDLPDTVRKSLGTMPSGFLTYFTSRWPPLLLHVWRVVKTSFPHEPMFAVYLDEDAERL